MKRSTLLVTAVVFWILFCLYPSGSRLILPFGICAGALSLTGAYWNENRR